MFLQLTRGTLPVSDDRTLNHITALRDPESRHYNVHEFRAEKRAALSRWAEEIQSIIEPVVVPIHKGRRR
jgi:hypothetical protein